ncbi:hypothetical protein I3760_01G154300 [Carya illinoinensis]|uniref:BTB/POZ and MATH domain-containing protein 2-like isoform X2 n=1 Tax=Carya illinoinensis TaxID=32201 RepID=UPI001BF57885|nr:BTB/POZ and MATH domain-containing protein 2-like isoform X2 [Carya illinoinensis]KAG2727368.1 hypothetical protein I3760_01G154300 [Carya illinoinensis]
MPGPSTSTRTARALRTTPPTSPYSSPSPARAPTSGRCSSSRSWTRAARETTRSTAILIGCSTAGPTPLNIVEACESLGEQIVLFILSSWAIPVWGYKRFYKRTLLETSDYLKDDCLIIHCCVGVVKSHTEGPKIYSITVPPSDIGQHFGKLLESGKGTDVSFEVDGEVFAAHKLVLAARSPVFRAQLFGPMKDQYSQSIKVEDMLAPVFKVILYFIYWDALPDMQELFGLESKWASSLMAQHLLAAADRYALERLRLLCEAKLCEDVAINTVATTLALAEQHHCFQLKDVCLKFIVLPENLRAVMQTDGFEYLKESCPCVLGELLQYVARIGKHSVKARAYHNDPYLDGSDVNGRRVKPRLY